MSAPLIAAPNPSLTGACPRCGTALAHDHVRLAGVPIPVHSHCPGCLGSDWPETFCWRPLDIADAVSAGRSPVAPSPRRPRALAKGEWEWVAGRP